MKVKELLYVLEKTTYTHKENPNSIYSTSFDGNSFFGSVSFKIEKDYEELGRFAKYEIKKATEILEMDVLMVK